jgi:hypothetical protein
MLLAALQALVVECDFILTPTPTAPCDITTDAFRSVYGINPDLWEDFRLLREIRNEIVHPAHAPCGEPDNWPKYLKEVKSRGLLNTTGAPDGDHTMLGQMASVRLMEWALATIRQLYEVVIDKDPSRPAMFRGFLGSLHAPWFD